MCGITGIVSLEGEFNLDFVRHTINKQTRQLAHRGPDAEGYFIQSNAAFGHRRLSIIDISSNSNQPFHDTSGRYVIVYNGEIYNYLEVRKLINDYAWQSNSDTEVILAAYIKWGAKCLEKLNGMFAFAIWDRYKKELFIARDRMGVKPLYYFSNNQFFIFSSEIRSLLASELVAKNLDYGSIINFLTHQAVKTPKTIFKGVQQLPPGSYATISTTGFSIIHYWTIVKQANQVHSLNLQQTQAKVKRLFTEAVQSRMVADVPVSAFLSGGIDSSAIVATMSLLSSKPIETFSIIFNEKAFDESKYAQIIAKKYGTKHTELLLDPNQLLEELPSYFSSMDSPTTDGINTYMVSKLVAQTGTRVALSGLGGDELFAGYEGFKRYRQFNRFNNSLFKAFLPIFAPLLPSNRIGNKLAQFLSNPRWNLNTFYENNRAIFLSNEIQKLGLSTYNETPWLNLSSSQVTNYPELSQYSIAELTNYTLDVLLKDTDQMSMASSLEVREPFFDYRLIEFILSTPDIYKYDKEIPKSLLVQSLGNLLPSEIIHRPKKGFTFPWEIWLKTKLKDYCQSSITSLSQRGIFEAKPLERMYYDFNHGKNGIIWLHIWSLVTLEKYLDENKI